MLRKSNEDADADRIARDQELLDFDDISYDAMSEEEDATEMILYQPRAMSNAELFYAYHLIRA